MPLHNSRILLETWQIDGHGGVARHAASRQVRRRGGSGSNVNRYVEGSGEADGRKNGKE